MWYVTDSTANSNFQWSVTSGYSKSPEFSSHWTDRIIWSSRHWFKAPEVWKGQNQRCVENQLNMAIDQLDLTIFLRYLESGIFGIPLTTLLEWDQKKLTDENLRVPLILQEAISYLEKNGLSDEGILRVPGSAVRIKNLNQARYLHTFNCQLALQVIKWCCWRFQLVTQPVWRIAVCFSFLGITCFHMPCCKFTSLSACKILSILDLLYISQNLHVYCIGLCHSTLYSIDLLLNYCKIWCLPNCLCHQWQKFHTQLILFFRWSHIGYCNPWNSIPLHYVNRFSSLYWQFNFSGLKILTIWALPVIDRIVGKAQCMAYVKGLWWCSFKILLPEGELNLHQTFTIIISIALLRLPQLSDNANRWMQCSINPDRLCCIAQTILTVRIQTHRVWLLINHALKFFCTVVIELCDYYDDAGLIFHRDQQVVQTVLTSWSDIMTRVLLLIELYSMPVY